MKEYEIRVTNTEDPNDFATDTYYDGNEATADDIIGVVNKALALKEALIFKCGNMVIVIEEASNESGFYYTCFASQKDYEEDNDMDGGLCTGTLSDAIEMALC